LVNLAVADFPFPWQEPKRLPWLYLMQCLKESFVQAQILELLAMYRVDAVPIDAGGRRQRGRMMGAAKAAGMDLGGIQNVKTGRAIPKGFADLEATLAPEGRSLYIEVKAPRWIGANGEILRPAGKPTPEQLEFLLSKHVRGAVVMVAWSSFEVDEFLRSQLERNKKALV
jgi:hypothetical protein